MDILFRQRILACGGFYTGKLDGRWGDQTNSADIRAHTYYASLQELNGPFDPRTETNIATLLPKAQVKARECMRILNKYKPGLSFQILSGTRTYAEQNGLFAQRPRVTKARGGQSNHNFGIAWDFGIFMNGHYLTGATPAEEAAYTAMAHTIKSFVIGIEWGGDWKSICDEPHIQLATGKTISQIRQSFENGQAFV